MNLGEAAENMLRNLDIPPYFYWKFHSLRFGMDGQRTLLDGRPPPPGQPVINAGDDDVSFEESLPWAQGTSEIEQVTSSIHE